MDIKDWRNPSAGQHKENDRSNEIKSATCTSLSVRSRRSFVDVDSRWHAVPLFLVYCHYLSFSLSFSLFLSLSLSLFLSAFLPLDT